ncbi:MAG: NAD-glutamate dehydrogenase [Sphingomonadales bacterium]|nr:NAD-glutamate dehydrogenase [Sphingomonadales bacterium]
MGRAGTTSEERRTGKAQAVHTGELVPILAERLAAALLPADSLPGPGELDEAARFLLATGAVRAADATALAIDTVSGTAGARYMRIAVINADMPFLVDSIAAAIAAQDLEITRLIHPVLPVRRASSGRIEGFGAGAAPGLPRESFVYIETRRGNARVRAALARALARTLADVRAAVADWPAMRAAMRADADALAALDRAEGAALLRWFEGGMLTQLGALRRQRDGSERDALGICRKGEPLLSAERYDQAFAWFETRRADDRLPLVLKSRTLARVHRRAPLDLFLVPIYQSGIVVEIAIHAGIWTSAALAAPPAEVPRLRAQLAQFMARHGFSAQGHAGKALAHALTKLPHDILIGFSDADCERVAMAMMSLIDRPRPALALVAGALGRNLFAFVWLPRDALTTSARLDIAEMLTGASGGRVLDWTLEVEGSALAQLLFVIDRPPNAAPPEESALDARLQAMLRGWSDAVEAELVIAGEGSRAAAIAARYADSFPPSYRIAYGAAEAAADITRLRALDARSVAPGERAVRLYRFAGDGPHRLRLKIYQQSGVLTLSGAVPALENFGFRVADTFPFRLTRGEETLASLHDFLLDLPSGIDPEAVIANRPAIEAAMTAVGNNRAESDGFNRLLTGVGLAVEEANWLRAWYRYLRQAGMSFDIATVVEAMIAAPKVTHALVALFRARHDGAPAGETREAAAMEAIREGLSGVAKINDDRLLRAFRALILSIVRCNVFATGAGGSEATLAFKLDSAAVPGLPKPLPWREIWVYSPRVEGVHLRAGPIARGGIRWSDRRDDFRTEVLGLMKAQRVKNAVIVPTGAKGGFYPKRLPDPQRYGREAWAAEGRASYQDFIRALLSVTDTIVDGLVVHPAGVIARDGDDPYFVVAADKGTASFSDTANAIAGETDFWLDDAFASGGSKGYDHKAMGITARGAWLSVQRHFREMGIDIQTQPVRVCGVGDMSGDVFGNGMLLSRQLRLVAAFDHRHIFLDPDPDPARAWAERQRLFGLERSSWDDYDRTLLSPGGGIFPRSLKAIALSEEVRAVLGIRDETLDPDALISAILTAPVDLLWFGGIGTYVKAAGENHAAVGDHANDAVRVDGRALRARVIGEGANLGCTQAGRIEAALGHGAERGLRINTDFIDNSAGVDCSDKEVNIKIALAAAKRAGRLDEPGRVALLVAMTEDVAALVLEDNRLQALALSIAEAGGAAAMPSQARLIEQLEDSGQLDRATEGLAEDEALARRGAEGKGLTRPELAVLLSSAKLVLQGALEASTVPDDPGLDTELAAAFPSAMRARFAPEIAGHRLRREIIATRLANRLINRIGFVHPFELAEEEGVSLAEVASAFIAAERLFAMAETWQAIEDAAMPEHARLRLFEAAALGLRSQMADLLRVGAGQHTATSLADALRPGIANLVRASDNLLAGASREQQHRLRMGFCEAGAPEALADRVTRLFDLDGAVALARLAADLDLDAVALTRAFMRIGARLGLDWAQVAAAAMAPADPWERLLAAGLARDFQHMRVDFLRRLLARDRRARKGADPLAQVQHWLATQEAAVAQFRAMVARAQLAPQPGAAMLAQIASQARNLLNR